MGSTARRFLPRAPRYILRPFDNKILRFKGLQIYGAVSSANVRDLSETGLAFVLNDVETPELNEVLKVEFTVPGRMQIACFASVTRVEREARWDSEDEPESPGTVKIAIRFHNLPPAHLRTIQTSLAERVVPEDGDIITTEAAVPMGLVLRLSLAAAGLVAILMFMAFSPTKLLSIFGG